MFGMTSNPWRANVLRVWLAATTLSAASGTMACAQEADPAPSTPVDVIVIREDTILDPQKSYGRLVIAASNIHIDGQGIVLTGSESAAGNKRTGTAISAEGISNVVLKNVSAHGWETGLHIKDGEKWTVENCDFSDNFHDPDYGWGENGRRGGIVLERVRSSTLRKNRANRVWDACVLLDSSDNLVEDNDFSHTSNTCLKLWTASRNAIINNKLSHGIRITPGEVHARDSTSVLIESGSNGNRFVGNDCTYGGDGIFIRVLNGWCSTDNYFEKNDCSYANNNGIECWAPRNEFVRNRANHCSYGFWLGGSDQTRLIENEASFNGLANGNHNSPHLPDNGHAGIVFMFGPSSHVVARSNRCEGNNGAGIALIGDLESAGDKWRAYHWILQNNELHGNRWGLYAQYADWIRTMGNRFSGNTLADVMGDVGVKNMLSLAANEASLPALQGPTLPRVELVGPASVVAGTQLIFECRVVAVTTPDATSSTPSSPSVASPSPLPTSFEWELGDGTRASTATVEHVYRQPGFYRVGVNAQFEQGLELAFRDLVVVANVPELAADPRSWGFEAAGGLGCSFVRDSEQHVAGEDSIRCDINPYHGGLVRLEVSPASDTKMSLQESDHLGFWLKAINPNMPGWQSNNPEVILRGREGAKLTLTPKRDLFNAPQASEAREGWRYIEVPVGRNDAWDRAGELPAVVESISIGIDSWDAQPFTVWIDGVIVN